MDNSPTYNNNQIPLIITPGSMLGGRFKIIDMVKSGAGGAIYKAKNIANGNMVAVKEIIPPARNQKKKEYYFKALEREIGILVQLDHPGLPKILDFLSSGNRRYIIMTFIEGQDLEEKFKSNNKKPFHPNQIYDIFIQILRIINYLHLQEPPIIHRDIKPANIIIDYKGRVYLVDFGVARTMEYGTRATIVGTPGYTAPEQFAGKVEPRSDIYSLGATLFHLLTGISPGDTFFTGFSKNCIKKINPNVSFALEDLILSMVSPSPNDRPYPASSIVRILENRIMTEEHSSELFKKGLTYYNMGKVDEAIKTFGETIAFNPGHLSAYLWRGKAKLQQGNFASAVEDFTHVTQLDPHHALAYNLRGTAYGEKGDLKKAESDLRKAVQLDKEMGNAWFHLGVVHYDMGEKQKALHDFSFAIEAEPGNFEYHLWRGILYLQKNEYISAIKDFSTSLELEQESLSSAMGIGISYMKMNNYQSAMDSFSKAIEIDGEYPPAYHYRALCLENLRDFNSATEDYTTALSLDQEYSQAYLNRGLLYQKWGNMPASIQDFNRVIHFNPDYHLAYNSRGISFYRLGDQIHAQDDFNRATILKARFPDIKQESLHCGEPKSWWEEMMGI